MSKPTDRFAQRPVNRIGYHGGKAGRNDRCSVSKAIETTFFSLFLFSRLVCDSREQAEVGTQSRKPLAVLGQAQLATRTRDGPGEGR